MNIAAVAGGIAAGIGIGYVARGVLQERSDPRELDRVADGLMKTFDNDAKSGSIEIANEGIVATYSGSQQWIGVHQYDAKNFMKGVDKRGKEDGVVAPGEMRDYIHSLDKNNDNKLQDTELRRAEFFGDQIVLKTQTWGNGSAANAGPITTYNASVDDLISLASESVDPDGGTALAEPK